MSNKVSASILLVEDDEAVARTVGRMLTAEGYDLKVVHDGRSALEAGRQRDCDLIILDLTLPHLDGLRVLEELRRSGIETPVLILSARQDWDSKLQGLRVGADDYVTKPFHRGELLARLQSVLRRAKVEAGSVVEVGPITIDLAVRTAAINGKTLSLTPKEYAILELLALRHGNAVSKEAILDYIYKGMDEPRSRIVEVFICRLRQKIAAETGGDECIKTMRGRGFYVDVAA